LESLHVWTNVVQGSTKYVDSGMCLTLQNQDVWIHQCMLK